MASSQKGLWNNRESGLSLHHKVKSMRNAGFPACCRIFSLDVAGVAAEDKRLRFAWGWDAMIKAALFGLSLVLNAAVEPLPPQPAPDTARLQMSAQQKNAVVQPLMRSATDCIVSAVSNDPKFQASME